VDGANVSTPEPSPNMSSWQWRIDVADGPQALRWHQKAQPLTADCQPGIVLIGFACDEGVRRNGGRTGAAEGPQSIRQTLANFAWHQTVPVYDAGDVFCAQGNLEEAQARLAEVVSRAVSSGHWPLILGGGHQTAWGTFQGIAATRPAAKIGVINIDAHLDLRCDLPGNSGTPFAQIAKHCQVTGSEFRYLCIGVSRASNTLALFERARTFGAQLWFDKDIQQSNFQKLRDDILSFAEPLQCIHLSIDLDVLPAATMPAVSAPAGRGVSQELIESVISSVLDTGRVVAADLVEFNPSLDADGRGARVAARLAWQIATEWHSQELKE
jgi:formiminoglutamase